MQVDDAIDSSLLDVSGAPSGALSSRFKIDQFRVVSINRDSARGVSRAVEVLIEVHHGRPGFYDGKTSDFLGSGNPGRPGFYDQLVTAGMAAPFLARRGFHVLPQQVWPASRSRSTWPGHSPQRWLRLMATCPAWRSSNDRRARRRRRFWMRQVAVAVHLLEPGPHSRVVFLAGFFLGGRCAALVAGG